MCVVYSILFYIPNLSDWWLWFWNPNKKSNKILVHLHKHLDMRPCLVTSCRPAPALAFHPTRAVHPPRRVHPLEAPGCMSHQRWRRPGGRFQAAQVGAIFCLFGSWSFHLPAPISGHFLIGQEKGSGCSSAKVWPLKSHRLTREIVQLPKSSNSEIAAIFHQVSMCFFNSSSPCKGRYLVTKAFITWRCVFHRGWGMYHNWPWCLIAYWDIYHIVVMLFLVCFLFVMWFVHHVWPTVRHVQVQWTSIWHSAISYTCTILYLVDLQNEKGHQH